MSSVSRSTRASADLKRAERLKEDLVRFVTEGPLKEEFDRQGKLFLEPALPGDELQKASFLDWFLFDWMDEEGEGVVSKYLLEELGTPEAEREILLDWLDSISSVFEIRSVSKNSLQLRDLDSGDLYDVKTRADQAALARGDFIIARLLQLGDGLMLSGPEFVLPDREAAANWLEVIRAFESWDSPEKREQALREQVAAFCELFGCDELTVASAKLNSTLQRFQRYLLTERRNPETGLTAVEKARKEFGRELNVPDAPSLQEAIAGTGEVTILCDDFEGIVLLPDFIRFRRVFESDEPDRQIPDWKELVWTYVKNPDIPIVAFERVAEQFPVRVEKVLRSLLADKDFSLEHLYAVLLHYKQPVDGLEDLKDDQQLWDLFDGHNHAKPAKAAAAKPKPRSRVRTATGKSRAAKPSSKKKADTVGTASRAAKRKRPSANLATRRKPRAVSGRQRAAGKSPSRKSTSAKKR